MGVPQMREAEPDRRTRHDLPDHGAIDVEERAESPLGGPDLGVHPPRPRVDEAQEHLRKGTFEARVRLPTHREHAGTWAQAARRGSKAYALVRYNSLTVTD